MRNKTKTRKGFRVETEDRKCFPDIETSRPDYAIYPELCSSSSHTFMYMRNFDTRDYQMEISLSSVTQNTLIVIPTGLGKTFIAAMLIINFYRWFPTGKIIFMATSRPLVKQQMDSIKRLSVIPKKDIVEITGGVNRDLRTNHWQNSKVFFGTPQAIQKDIERGACPISQIVLIVVDEAHHARGNHSYCQIIRKVAEVTKFFRVIALTATPGSTVYDIQQVIFNLMISKIEIRTDDDCAQYVHTRDIQSILVPDAPGVAELSARLNAILQEYLEKLLKMSLVTTKDPTRTSKGKIAMLMKTSHSGEACIAIKQSIRLLNLREKLENYSIPFFTHDLEEYVNSTDRPIDDTNDELKKLLNAAKNSPQEDPKMKKLIELVVNFLQTSSEKSKIIVFCSYRNVVKEIAKNLTEASPVVKCAEFVGQSSSSDGLRGLNQPKQLKIMDAFKRGIYNVLISTSIGEEGLDIGEVDLIICYDVQKSATRTVQRMGRTGRHQDGNVIFLLTEATKNLLHTAEKAPDSTSNLISRNMNEFEFYKDGPKMNDNKLQTIFKKFSVEEMEDYEKQVSKEKEVKRAVLLTSELDELHEHHGEKLSYRKLNLDEYIDYIAGAVFCSNINMSCESKLLSEVYSSIFQASVQCSPMKSLSFSSQSTANPKNKASYNLDNDDDNLSNKSPFAIDESSSQKMFSNISPSSSQRKPEKISVRRLLNLDMSTDTSASDSDYEYDILSPKNKKKKTNQHIDTSAFNEFSNLKKSARNDLKNEVMEMVTETTMNDDNDDDDIDQPLPKKKIISISDSDESSDASLGLSSSSSKNNNSNNNNNNDMLKIQSSSSFGKKSQNLTMSDDKVESFKRLSDIDELTSSESISNNNNNNNNYNNNNSYRSNSTYEKNSHLNDYQDDGSGFISPNTRSNSTSSSKFGASPHNKNLSPPKRNEKKSISLVSGNNSDYEEEEDYSTSLSGFIVNSSDESQNSQLLLKHIQSSGSSSQNTKAKHKINSNRHNRQKKNDDKNHHHHQDQNIHKYNVNEDDDDSDVSFSDFNRNNNNFNENHNNNNFHEINNNNNDDIFNTNNNSNFQEIDISKDNFETNNNNINSINDDDDDEDDDIVPPMPDNSKETTNEDPTPKRENELLRFFTSNDLERIINQENETKGEGNQRNFLNSSSDDIDELIYESSSFVSASSEIINSEINDYDNDDEGSYGIERKNSKTPTQVIVDSSDDEDNEKPKNNFLEKIMENEEEEISDMETNKEAVKSSKNYANLLKYQTTYNISSSSSEDNNNDDENNNSHGIKKNVSAEKISFIPLGKLINDENLVKNTRKVDVPNIVSSSDSYNIEDSSD